jgi:hypothetical protein
MSRAQPSLPEPPLADSASMARLRAQVLEQARREPAATRGQLLLGHARVAALIALTPVSIFLAVGGVRAAPRPLTLVIETALGSALLALIAAKAGFGRGRSMLGRPRVWLVSIVLLTPLALFAWRILTSSHYPDMTHAWAARPGLRCFLLSCAMSAVPLLGVLWLRRHMTPANPRLTAASYAAAVGAAVWVLVDLWCPVGYAPHLLLGHVLPMTLLMSLSASIGKRFFD